MTLVSHQLELTTLTDVEDHLHFIRLVLSNHQFPSPEQQSIEQQIDVLIHRIADPNLYLTVVGEMSIGKTTLLNAFLRAPLLRAHSLVMTTAVATLIRSGTELGVELHFPPAGDTVPDSYARMLWLEAALNDEPANIDTPQSERVLVRRGDTAAAVARLPKLAGLSIEAIIEQATTDPLAQQLLGVNITHQAQILKNGLVLIDTPGLNATNPDHAESARNAVARADAALIIIPADKPVSQTFVQFLSDPNVLLPYLHRCIFLVSRIDIVPANQREQLLQTTARRLANYLRLDTPPVVYPCAAQAVMDDLRDEQPGVKDRGERTFWQSSFAKLEATIVQRLKHERSVTIAESVLRLLDSLIAAIEAPLRQRWSEYQTRVAQLDRARIQNLNLFAVEQHAECARELDNARRAAKARASEAVIRYRNQVLEQMRAGVFAANSVEVLKAFLQDGHAQALEKAERDLQHSLHQLFTELGTSAQQVNTTFEHRFRAAYARLAVLGGVAVQPDFAGADLLGNPQPLAGAIQGQSLARQGGTAAHVGAGAVVGAIIGGMFLPGVGLWLGGALGSWLGSKFGPSLEQIKQQAWSDLNPKLISILDPVEYQVQEAVQAEGQRLEGVIQNSIDAHVQAYHKTVITMIEEHEAQRRTLQELQLRADNDLHDLLRRRTQVQQRRASLRGL